MLSSKKTRTFDSVLREELAEIDRQYGALIAHDDDDSGFDYVYLISGNVDAIFTSSQDEWGSLDYKEKFAFSKNFAETRKIFFYVNHSNMESRAARTGDSLEITARLLARDTAVVVQRSFSDIVTAHALEITQEEGRATVTIVVDSTETAADAERIAELIDYMLFLHYVAT